MRKLNIKRPLCFVCVFYVLFIYLLLTLNGGLDLGEYHHDKENTVITGKIYGMSRKNFSNILYVKNKVKYVIYLNEEFDIDYFKIGQTVTINGIYSNFNISENEGQFNMRKYYRIRGFEASVKKARVVKASKSYDVIKDSLFRIKEKTKALFEKSLSEEDAGIMTALVLGDKDLLNSDIKMLYQDAGISHILALSGLHIATVGMFILKSLKKTGISTPAGAFISSVIMCLYAVMTGLSTSTVRALIMFILGVVAKSIGRTYDLLTAVSLSAILLLFENPYYVYDSGFLLSICAVIGITLLCPIFESLFKIKVRERDCYLIKALKNVTLFILKGLSVSLSATLGTLPVTISSFYRISRFGIFINVLIIPLVGVLLFLGILSALINLLAFGRLAYLIIVPVKYILLIYSYLAMGAVSLKHNTWIIGAKESWQYFIYVFLILFSVFIFRCGLRLSETVMRNNIGGKNKWNKRIRWMYLSGCINVIILACIILTSKFYPDISVNALSVGQGACNVIYGKNIPTIMIDSGSTDVREVYKYRVEPMLMFNGISKIDYLFITHPDKDHISGVVEMLEGDDADYTGKFNATGPKNQRIKVGHIFMSIYDENIFNLATRNDIKISIIGRGDSLRNSELYIECVHPDLEDTDYKKMDDIKATSEETLNDRSLVLEITHIGTESTFVYTGDISSEAESEIISYKTNKRLKGKATNHSVSHSNSQHLSTFRKALFMSIPHHGSRYSSSPDFLKLYSPRICAISAGKNNSYGHPHQETLERLNQYAPNAKVLRTDECGQVIIAASGNVIRIKRFNDKN